MLSMVGLYIEQRTEDVFVSKELKRADLSRNINQ